MKIGFDAKKIIKNKTGIGNYSRRCINAISSYLPNISSYLFVPKQKNDSVDVQKGVIFILPPAKFLFEIWRILLCILDIKKLKLDIFHGLSNEIPFLIKTVTNCRTIVTIHDLIFLRHPETYGLIQRQILKAKTRYACNSADQIIAISQKTKQEIIHWYKIPEERISVVYQSINDIYFNEVPMTEKKAIAKRLNIQFPYVICVGTIEQRKNQLTAVRSLKSIDESIHLYLIGKATTYQKTIETEIEGLGLSNRVHVLNDIKTEDLPTLYQMALAMVYMSIYEGFGLPVAEAAASGIPIITAQGSCLEEAGGPYAFYLSAYDSESVASKINYLAEHPTHAKNIGEQNKIFAQRFTDKSFAYHLNEVYKTVLAKK